MGLVCSKMETCCAMVKRSENRARILTSKFESSDLLALPAAAFEEDDAGGSDEAFSDDDGPKDAVGMQTERNRQEIGQGNFQEPEAEEIHDGGSDGIARAVEGLKHDHAIGVADVAVAENAQAGDGQRNNERIICEEANDRFSEDDEEDADDTEKDHVVKAGAPDGSFRALGLFGAEVLADESGGGVAEAPAWHEDEYEDADGDGVTGEGSGTKDADDAHEADPTGVGDGELQDASERDAQKAKQDAEVKMNLAAQDADALGAAEKAIKLIEYADAAAGEGCKSRASHPKFWKRSPAKDEARVEDEIDDVGDPQQTHGDGGVTCAAEDSVVEKEHHDGGAAAEGDAGVAGADGNDLRGSTHQAKQVRGVEETRSADNGGDHESNDDGLNACDGCAGGIFFADAASNHGGCGKAEAEANGHDETEKRLGEADGGDGVGAETADPENVDDSEKGFQDHFHNHGNGEEENGAIEIAGGEVLVRAAEGFADGAPERGRRGGNSLFRGHIDLYVLRGRFPGYRCADAAAAVK